MTKKEQQLKKQEQRAIEIIEDAIVFLGIPKKRAVHRLLKKLIAHRDQTVGLWATDLPGAVKDPKKVMFEIKF